MELLINPKTRFIIDKSEVATLIHENGLAKNLNMAFARMFGYHKYELVNRNIIKLLFPEKYHGVIKEYIRRDYKSAYEVEGIRKDGTKVYLLIKGKAMENTKNFNVRLAEFRYSRG